MEQMGKCNKIRDYEGSLTQEDEKFQARLTKMQMNEQENGQVKVWVNKGLDVIGKIQMSSNEGANQMRKA